MSTTSVKASSSTRNALEGPDTSSIARLLHQYGCGPIPFVGSENAFYERHLVFDRVIDPQVATARERFEALSHYRELTAEFGSPYYTRIDAPASPEQKSKLQKLTPEAVKESDLAGEPITAKLTRAPGNNAPIGGLKVAAGSGWFAARPSGTENICKIYAESFKSREHLHAIVREAQEMVSNALDSPGFGAQTGVWQ